MACTEAALALDGALSPCSGSFRVQDDAGPQATASALRLI